MKLFFILGNQLFPLKYLDRFKKDHVFFMAEDNGLCTYEKHHKQKILLFLSSMRSYADNLKKNKFKLNNLKIEDNGPRLLAARMQLLDDAVAAWHGGVGLWIRDDKPLEQLKSALRDDGPGKAEVKLHFTIDGHDVRVALAGRFKLSGELRQNLRRISGILEVRDL